MAICRTNKDGCAAVCHLRDESLSLRAKGLLSLMLALPDDWRFTQSGLAEMCREGVSAVNAALRELERCGYLTRRRARNERGQLGNVKYTIYEQPQKSY
jgi:DNA-binding MarR family transcriptional regulator